MTNVETEKRPDLVTAIAVYHFVHAGIMLLGRLGVGIAGFAVLFVTPDKPSVGISLVMLGLAALVLLVILAANVAVGWGLLVLQNWARWAAIVLSVFRLVSFPVGTVIGGLIIYYLFQDEAKVAFEGA